MQGATALTHMFYDSEKKNIVVRVLTTSLRLNRISTSVKRTKETMTYEKVLLGVPKKWMPLAETTASTMGIRSLLNPTPS